jgi:hypothetical protein
MAALPPKKPAAKKPASKKSPPKPARPKPPKPLDYMLAVLRDEAAEPARRDEMAKLAAPYLHAKAKELVRDELAGKTRRKKTAATETETTGSRDADPIIRTARATLQRKLARLAAKSAAENDPGGAEP